MAWWNNALSWLGDAVGWGEGGILDGWGVSDDTGGYTGVLGTGNQAGTGGYAAGQAGAPGAGGVPVPDYEAEREEADRVAAERMQGVRDTIGTIEGMAADIPTFTEWMEQNGYALNTAEEEYAGMQELIDRLQGGPTEGDYDEAFEHSARLMGLTGDEAQSMLGDLTRQMAEGVSGQSGMTDEEMALRQRQNQSNLRMAEERARRMVQDTFADSGSTARMFQAADQATMQINNMQIQQDAALAQEDFERALAEFQSKKAAQQTMIENNQVGTKQYIDALQTGMAQALTGYAQKVTLLLQENQQYFMQYRADLDKLQLQITSLYQAANLELGVTQAEIDLSNELYTQSIQPYLDALNAQMLEDEMGFDWGALLAGAVQVVGGVALIIATGGAAAAPGVGMVASGYATGAQAF